MSQAKHLAGWAFMAAAAFWTVPAAAAASPVAAIAEVPIERMCGPDGALGYRFGATDGPPNESAFPGTTPMQLAPEFAPFDRGGLDSTKWSERIYAANYVAQLPDEESALAVIAGLARRFEQLGWTADRGISEEDAAARTTITYIAPGPGEVHLYWPAGATGPERKDGVRIRLTRLGSEVNFSCTDLTLFDEHLEEALGRLPEGTPRPVEPVLAMPPGIDPGTCDDPAKRAALMASRPEDSELIRYLNQRSRYRERLVAWKMDRLKKAGGLSEEQAMAIAMAAFEDPAAAGAMEAGLNLFDAMFTDMERLADAEAAKDETAACEALLAMSSKLEGIGDAADPHFDAMEAAIDAEAKRLGIALD